MDSKIIFIFIFLLNIQYNFGMILANESLDVYPLNKTVQNKIYLPEYQNKYIRTNELNNTNYNFSKIINSRNTVLISDDILNTYDEANKREKISEIIEYQTIFNNQSIINKTKYSDEYTFYAIRNYSLFNHNYVWYKFINKNATVCEKSTLCVSEVIKIEPEQLVINAPICSVQKIYLHIKNLDPKMYLGIKEIRSDIYQAQILSYVSPYKKNKISNGVFPMTTYTIEIYIIIDYIKPILGTLYIEFNYKKVFLIPIKITGIENKYGVKPIYHTDIQLKKFLSIPIRIFNPSQKVLVIKKVINPFQKINVLWPNNSYVISNLDLPDSSMIQIQPNSSVIIMRLKFYSTTPSNEYGIIKIITSDDSIHIPVLFNSISSPIITYPNIINFGLCQVASKSKYNIRKIIPLNILNKGLQNIEIGKVFLDYDNIFIYFHQNFNEENIIIKPNEEIKFGFLIFDANLVDDFEFAKKKLVGKFQKGSIYIETNSTDCPFIQVNYTFLPDMNKIEKIISGDLQKLSMHKNKYSFGIKIKYNAPYGLETMYQYKLGQNITLLNEDNVEVKTLNPKNEEQTFNVNIAFEIDKLDKLHYKRFYYIPLYLTYSLYSYIPIKLDNNDISIVYCGVEENAASLASCLRTFGTSAILDNLKEESNKVINLKFDFGSSYINNKRQRFLFLINENSSPIMVNEIFCNNYMISIGLENIEYLGNDEPPRYYPNKFKNLEKNIIKNLKKKDKSKKYRTSFILNPNTAYKLSINFNPTINDDMSIKGESTIKYNNNSKLIINNTAQIVKGSFDIIQTNLKFMSGFPGLVQLIDVYCKNSMNLPVTLYSVESTDNRIIPKLLPFETSSDGKTKFLQVYFEPSFDNLLQQFLSQINFEKSLTYRELYFWKEKEKYYNKLKKIGKTEINAKITIKSTMEKKYINVKSDLNIPNLIRYKDNEILFGYIPVGEIRNGYIEIFNPSDQILTISFIIAPNEYYNIEENNMFSPKEQKLLDISDDLCFFECNFFGKMENESTYINELEYILIPEKIDIYELKKNLIDKKDLIKLIYKHGNSKVKQYINNGFELFCKYINKDKNEMIINFSHLEVISNLYSDEFENEIDIVKNMTTKNYLDEDKSNEINKKHLWNKITSFFANLYSKYYLNEVNYIEKIKEPEAQQHFYIPQYLTEQLFIVSPHSKGSLGPIIFKPNKVGDITGTLLLKNNLTFIHPLKMKGIGIKAEPLFYLNHQKNNMDDSQILDKINYIIKIAENTYNTELKSNGKIIKTISIKNTGNYNMNVKNITIDGTKCQKDEIKIVQCKEFSLKPDNNIDIDIEIKPKINNHIIKKSIYFNCDYHVFKLNVIVINYEDIYIQIRRIINKIISYIVMLFFYIYLSGLCKTINEIFVLYKIIILGNVKKLSNDSYSKLKNEKGIERIENVNQSKNKKKKNKRKNKIISDEKNKRNINKEKEKSGNLSNDKKDIKKTGVKKEEDNYKEFKLYSPVKKKARKQQTLSNQKDEEKNKINKTEEKNNEIILAKDDKANIKKNIYEKSKKYNKKYSFQKWNYWNKPYSQRKSYSNIDYTYDSYPYDNNNNYNKFNDYNTSENKKQGKIIKLHTDKKVDNLSDLLKEEPKNEKKLKKNNKKEKKEDSNKIDKKIKYFPINKKIYNKINEINLIFLNNENTNKESGNEQELLNNIDENNLSKIESTSLNHDNSNSIYNDLINSSKIYSREEYESNEDIKDVEENIKDFFNKSLLDKIENPYIDEEKSKKFGFLKFDFFNDN